MSTALIQKLRYMARQYTAGSYARGGNQPTKHYLDEAADLLEQYHREASARCPDCGERSPADVHTCSPQKPASVEPVAWRAWFDKDNGARWLFTLWPQEERLDVDWEPLYTTPPDAEALRKRVASPTQGMSIADRILHVGGRNNAAGYVEFGSIQAVEALVRQVLRDTTPPDAEALRKRVAELEAELSMQKENTSTALKCGESFRKQRDALVDERDEARAEVERLSKSENRLAISVQEFLENVGEPPDSNCSCHIAPPCYDCEQWAALRQTFEDAKAAIAARKED